MIFRLLLTLVFCCCLILPARALDLPRAQSDGVRLTEALSLGERGQWAEAEAMVGADALLRDIVIWRKLRAGKGSIEEYRGYISRRPTWPGREALERVVFNEARASRNRNGRCCRRTGLSGGVFCTAAEKYASDLVFGIRLDAIAGIKHDHAVAAAYEIALEDSPIR